MTEHAVRGLSRIALGGVLAWTTLLLMRSEAPLWSAGLLIVGCGAAAFTLERIVGSIAAFWVAVALLGSMTGEVLATGSLPDLASLASVSLGMAILFWREVPTQARVRDVYDLPLDGPRWPVALAGAVAGLLLGVPALQHPVRLLLPVSVALLLLVLDGRRGGTHQGARARGFAAGAVLALVLVLAVGSVAGSTGGSMDHRSDDRVALELGPVERAGLASQGSVLARNGVGVLFGRHLGILFAFPLAAFALFAYEASRLRGALLAGALLVVVGALLFEPFDWWGGASVAGDSPPLVHPPLVHRHFLALYPVFWFLGSRYIRISVTSVALLASVLWIGPRWLDTWIAPLAPDAAERLSVVGGASWSRLAGDWLPVETTQRWLRPSGLPDREQDALWLRRLDGTTTARGARVPEGSTLRVPVGRRAELLVASPDELEALVLRVGGTAPSSIGLRGGEVARLMLEPEGGVRFEIEPELQARHPTWWSREPVFFYDLRFALPRAGGGEPTYRLRFERGRLLDSRAGN